MEWIYGNGIAEIGGEFVAIVAMSLLKMGGKKMEWNCVTLIIFLQYFHNKSQVISYY